MVGGFFKELSTAVRAGVYEVRERMEEKEKRAIEGECRRRAEENIFQMRRRGILPFYQERKTKRRGEGRRGGEIRKE